MQRTAAAREGRTFLCFILKRRLLCLSKGNYLFYCVLRHPCAEFDFLGNEAISEANTLLRVQCWDLRWAGGCRGAEGDEEKEKEQRRHRDKDDKHRERHKEKREHKDRDRERGKDRDTDRDRKERHREKRGHERGDEEKEDRKRERHR